MPATRCKRSTAANREAQETSSEASASAHGRRRFSDVRGRRVHFGSQARGGGASRSGAGDEDGGGQASDTDDDSENASVQEPRVTMAVANTKAGLGVAYFSPTTSTLYLTEDVVMSGDNCGHDLVCMLVEQAAPDLVLLSSKTDDALYEAIRSTLSTMTTSENSELASSSTSKAPKVQIRPAREFSEPAGQSALHGLSHALQRALNLDPDDGDAQFSSSDDFQPHQGFGRAGRRSSEATRTATITANSLVNPDASPITLSAVACLLSYLSRTKVGSEGGRWDEAVEVRAIEMLSFSCFMHLPQSTLAALSIFSTESHASLHSSKTSEGLSLFGILDSCRTLQGRQLLRTWLQRPTTEKHVILQRQAAIACLRRLNNAFAVDSLQVLLKMTHNLLRTVRIIEAGKERVRDWQKLLAALYGIISLAQELASLNDKDDVELFSNILVTFDVPVLQSLGQTVESIVDFDESKIQGGTRVCVKPSVDEELDELKTRFENLPELLDRIATKIGQDLSPELAEDFHVCYIPQLGYLCTIDKDPDWDARSVHDHVGWDLQFRDETREYFKTEQMRELDTHLGDLQSKITDREIEIVHALQAEVRKYDELMTAVNKLLAELDSIVSLSEVARHGEWTRPIISDENIIRIRGGRHPLVEACVGVYISNDTGMMGGRGAGWNDEAMQVTQAREDIKTGTCLLPPSLSLLVVTGANFSGKSAYLKQVALLVILAQIGSFVPAEEMEVGIHDAVFTRVATRESVSKGESAFMIDLQQVSYMLRNATSRSLLLIDEFGKGTDSAGLFCGVIRHLLEQGAQCPTTLVATHFHAVFSNNLFPSHLPIGFAHMQVVLPETFDQGSVDDGSSFTYLYRLAPGLATESHALACAALFGIPLHVRQRAAHVSDLLGRFEVLELIDVGMTDEEKDDMRQSEDTVRRFVEADIDVQAEESSEEVAAWLGQLIES